MNDSFILLSHCLEQETQWIDDLNHLLHAEKTCLETRQFKDLEALATKKQALSSLIESSAQKRQQQIHASGKTAQELLAQLAPKEQEALQRLNQQLAEHLTLCQELNTINGQVIANNLYVHQEIVTTLSGNVYQAINTYNAHGNVKTTPNSSHHQKA